MKPLCYLRVSKRSGMTVENQRLILEGWLKTQDVKPDDVLWLQEDVSTRKDRPIQTKAFNLIMSKEYDTLICARLDRWGRSVIELIDTIKKMVECGGRIIFVNQGLDLSKESYDAVSRMHLGIISVFAEYERDLIQERTLEGLERAKAEGKNLGRPKGSRDRNGRRRSGYWLRWDKEKNPEKYGIDNKGSIKNDKDE